MGRIVNDGSASAEFLGNGESRGIACNQFCPSWDLPLSAPIDQANPFASGKQFLSERQPNRAGSENDMKFV
ncbi:hypothetical protein KSZ_31530 [Dictyobacter formicarum]|uniref:Uncharacterized protein n=1 Tax=Dictyobacter formicarum TaxID=2778368 RepID=A0ABQ3VGT7_9CHLR|nr:hypothetical protein KSZ_31530 [Dictyobacter formicarum]